MANMVEIRKAAARKRFEKAKERRAKAFENAKKANMKRQKNRPVSDFSGKWFKPVTIG